MPNLNLIRKNDELINQSEICLYDGETANISFEVDFNFSKANIKMNNVFIGTTSKNQMGVHSSKFKNGVNVLCIDFFDGSNKLIETLQGLIIKRPSIRGKDSIEQEFTAITTSLEKLKQEVENLKKWQNEIDNERSGF